VTPKAIVDVIVNECTIS